MKKIVVGIAFKKAGKVYYFDPKDLKLNIYDKVIVETVRGIELGEVVLADKQIEDEDVISNLKPVIRVANTKDINIYYNNKEEAEKAFKTCKEKIKKHKLEMKLVDVEYTFDKTKIIFSFTAEERVDFRELVKDLAAVFKKRIELRQIGVRDEAKKMSGLGICGRKLCCSNHLREFHPVSIKMAKEQKLALNPVKISGICKRLMCCLQYENSTYEMLNKSMPSIGDEIKTVDGIGKVTFINPLRDEVKAVVQLNNKTTEVITYKVHDIEIKKRKSKGKDKSNNEKELKKLEDK